MVWPGRLWPRIPSSASHRKLSAAATSTNANLQPASCAKYSFSNTDIRFRRLATDMPAVWDEASPRVIGQRATCEPTPISIGVNGQYGSVYQLAEIYLAFCLATDHSIFIEPIMAFRK